MVHLEFGEPDFETPEVVREAAVRAIREGRTKYAHSLGLLPLREAIAEHYQQTYRVAVSPDQVLVTAGTSPAMLLLFTGLLSAGDEVVLSNPHYACYPNFVRYADAAPVYVPTPESDGWSLGAEAVRERLGPRTRAVMVNSPANPTGVVTSADRLAALAEVTERHGAWLVSDEIYHGLSYEGPDHTVLEFTDRAFVFNGFSKAYAMTGWRLGYLIAPKSYVRTLQRLHQNFFISSNEFVQWAGVAALREAAGDVRRFRAIFDERRRAMVAGAPGDRARGPGRADRGVLRLRGRAALLRAVVRLRLRDPGRRPRGRHAGHRLRDGRRGLPPVLVREQPAAHPRGAPETGRVPARPRCPRLRPARRSSTTPWDVRLARVLVRPLRHTPLTPNGLTTLGLLASLTAAWLMASRRPAPGRPGRWPLHGGVLVDHMDGEFARLTGMTSRFGHYYDHVAAGLGYVSLFAGLGIGLRSGWLGSWAPVAGAIAAGSIAIVFLIRVFLEETAGRAMVAQENWRGFEPEDALYLVGPVAWLGLLGPFLLAAAVGAPMFLLWVLWCSFAGRSATASPAKRVRQGCRLTRPGPRTLGSIEPRGRAPTARDTEGDHGGRRGRLRRALPARVPDRGPVSAS